VVVVVVCVDVVASMSFVDEREENDQVTLSLRLAGLDLLTDTE